MRRALVCLNFCGCEAVWHKLKNTLKTPKMHFLPVFELMSDSLTATKVETYQCPLHQSILLTQGPIHEIFEVLFCFIPMKTSQSSLVSKDGSKFWTSQMWQHYLTQTKHFDRECMNRKSGQINILGTSVLISIKRQKNNSKSFTVYPRPWRK